MQNVPQTIELVQESNQEPSDSIWDEQSQKEYAEWAAYNDAQYYGEQ
jgi:hypothetical protein